MKIGLIFGTRPEAIKMAPVYHELKENFEVKVIVTGQHKEMLYQILNIFDIKPDYELDLMKKGQELSELTSRMIISLDQIFKILYRKSYTIYLYSWFPQVLIRIIGIQILRIEWYYISPISFIFGVLFPVFLNVIIDYAISKKNMPKHYLSILFGL